VFKGIKHVRLEGILGALRRERVVEERIIQVVYIGDVQAVRLGVPILVCPCEGGR
jgi:hypothetical protein